MHPSYFATGQDENKTFPRPVRVMVVDDEPDTVVTMVTLLRTEGFDAKGANDPTSALRDLESFDPDVVIADIAMPGMSGWDLAREIRKLHRRRPMLIAISGSYVKAPDEMLARIAGFTHYFVKPCDPSKLIKVLGAIVPS